MLLERQQLVLPMVEPETAGGVERRAFQPDTIGIYSPGALGVALAYHLGTETFITRATGRSARIFPQEADLAVSTGDEIGQVRSFIHGRFSHGLVEAYRSNRLPELIFACPNADKVSRLIEELVDLTYAMAEDGILGIDAAGQLKGQENLPVIVLASNGILDESSRALVRQRFTEITQDGSVGENLAQSWLGKIVRGSAYVGAHRVGTGLAATYSPPKSGAFVLSGGEDLTRKRIIQLTQDKGLIRFVDGRENTIENEWRKAYTNLMTNVIGLILCVDKRRNKLQLNIPVGRLIGRMLPIQPFMSELEGATEWCEKLGKAFFDVAKAKGLFTQYDTWDRLHKEMFLAPIKDPQEFFTHIPSALQEVENAIRTRVLPDGVPASELAIIDPLIHEAERFDSQYQEAQTTLLAVKETIEENIAIIKDIYRRPQRGQPAPVIRTVTDRTDDTISFVAINPTKLGLAPEAVRLFITKSEDVVCAPDECVIPMTAEVLTYGPENTLGNVAYITNGAGFALEGLDRCVKAGVRVGYVSDLRLDFTEGKYYLAMKMALAANPSIDTIALNVLTTLGTSADVARAIKRIAEESPNLRFVVKLDGRLQTEGIKFLKELKARGLQITFTCSDENLPPVQIQSLTLDQMVRALRGLDEMEADEAYRIYEDLDLQRLESMLASAKNLRARYLLNPNALSADNAEEIENLREHDMFHPDAVFGKDYSPARPGNSLKGKPVVVIHGYGTTPKLQAQLMKLAGTEVVMFHPQIREKIDPKDQAFLAQLGINIYNDPGELQFDLSASYPKGVDIIGVSYEPYKPEITDDGIFGVRIEKSVDSLVSLKLNYGLNVVSILVPTEMVPTNSTKKMLSTCKNNHIWLIGPNSPGMSRAFVDFADAHLKIGQIPYQCILPGYVAIGGTGGTELFETLLVLKQKNIGISTAISLGGDVTRGLSARDAALIAENDPATKYFIYIGEPGGLAAQELAEVMRAGLITKPVIVRFIGYDLPMQCHIGHSGTVINGRDFERADVKAENLRAGGAVVVQTPEQMAQVIAYIDKHSEYGQIDTTTAGFKTAQDITKNLIRAQEAVERGFIGGGF